MKNRALSYLRTALGRPDADFRPGQWECIDGVLRRQRQLVVEKTGWGKSMVYFLGTRLLRDEGSGFTLLISPLLSLMRNQIAAAERIGIRAGTINSTNQDEWDAIERKLAADQVDILLISPERLANESFRERVLQQVAGRIGLFVVDEAHCISDWGHDFRPDYRRIVRVLQAMPPNLPVLATTATANNRVVADVATQLGAVQIVRGPLVRESLSLQNIVMPSPAARMAWLAQQLPKLPGSGIIYTLTVRDAERVTDWLCKCGLNVRAYHADVDADEGGADRRIELEQALLENRIKALVSTVALGMGFDKPDLGFVIHFQRPGSVVHYYQQVGRAGRAVDHAFGILLGGEEDKDITDYFIRSAFPAQAHVEQVLKALNDAHDGLSVPMLQQKMNLTFGDIEKTLKLLAVESPSPVAKIKTHWHATPVAYKMDLEKIRKLCELRQAEQQQMIEYLRTGECLMQFLGRALDDPDAKPCGKCANCLGQPVVSLEFDTTLANEAAIFLRRSYQPIEPRKAWPPDAFTVYPFRGKIAEDLAAAQGRALSLWGDAGWGQMVRDGKYHRGHFPDELVDGCIQMLGTWHPDPSRHWLTCIPSLTHPNLVPDFARRLAEKLKIPFVACITKTKVNEQQKRMANSFQQTHNLDGVFMVDASLVHSGPVLLIDDMVDSRWTFTVAAALLRQAGCGAVIPLALAMNSPRTD